jgi:hypothetical protein
MPYSNNNDSAKETAHGNAFVPSEESYEILEGMAMNGATHKQMAEALGICDKTLVKHYGDFLKSVKPLFDARVARQLKRHIFHEDPKIALDATKFYANSKMGYKQATDNNHTMEGLPSFTVNFSSEKPIDG